MDIQIISQTRNENRTYITMQGKRNEVEISYHMQRGSVEVIVKNASYQAWRGAGKTYRNWTEAKAAYKSNEMKAMLEFVEKIAA